MIRVRFFLYNIANFDYIQQLDYLKCEYPESRCYHTCNYYHKFNSVYIIGGWNGNISDLNKDKFTCVWKLVFINIGFYWEKIEVITDKENCDPKTISRRGHTSDLLNDKIYVFGGIKGYNLKSNELLILTLIDSEVSIY